MNPSSVALGDLAGRKVLDLVVAHRGENKVAVLSGNGDGTFKAAVPYAVELRPPRSSSLTLTAMARQT